MSGLQPSTGAVRLRAAGVASGERGLATVEYVILVMLIAVASIGAWTAFGAGVKVAIDCAARTIEDPDLSCSSNVNQDNAVKIDPPPSDHPALVGSR